METLDQAQQRAHSPMTRPNSLSTIIRNHATYYLPGGDLFILIDTTLFCIHSYFFKCESCFWWNLLRNTEKGRYAHHPINLNGDNLVFPHTPPDKFTSFLCIFYNPQYSLYNTTEATWLDIQHLAILWEMNEIQNLTYQELARFDTDWYLEDYLNRFHISTTTWQSLSSDPASLEVCYIVILHRDLSRDFPPFG